MTNVHGNAAHIWEKIQPERLSVGSGSYTLVLVLLWTSTQVTLPLILITKLETEGKRKQMSAYTY